MSEGQNIASGKKVHAAKRIGSSETACGWLLAGYIRTDSPVDCKLCLRARAAKETKP